MHRSALTALAGLEYKTKVPCTTSSKHSEVLVQEPDVASDGPKIWSTREAEPEHKVTMLRSSV
jgi:hypothetical protein